MRRTVNTMLRKLSKDEFVERMLFAQITRRTRKERVFMEYKMKGIIRRERRERRMG